MKRINLSINLHFSLLSFPYFALSFPQDSKCVLPVAPPRRRVSELLLRQLESNLLPALNCCRCLGDGLGGEQRLMQPRFQGAVHSMCISGSFAGQEEREGAGGVLGVVVLPASPGRGAGAKGTDKLLGAPMAGVCCCGQPQLVPACLASNTTRSAWCEMQISARAGKCKDWSGLDLELAHPVICLWHGQYQCLGNNVWAGCFRGVPPQFSSPQPPVTSSFGSSIHGEAFAHKLACGGAVEMHSMIFPKLSMSSFVFLAVTISCSKKFHDLITGFVKCHFLLFALNLLPKRASLEAADVSGGEGIPQMLLMLSLHLRWWWEFRRTDRSSQDCEGCWSSSCSLCTGSRFLDTARWHFPCNCMGTVAPAGAVAMEMG